MASSIASDRLAGGVALTVSLLLVLGLAPSARAAEPSAADKTLAQSLFDDGRKLMDAGKVSEACPRFADSERLDPGGGTVLNLALCYDKLGRLALAYTTYNEALSAAIAEHRADREAFSRERIESLRDRVPHLTLRTVDPPPGFTLRLDGAELPSSAWNARVPLDPGDHRIDAAAPGSAPFEVRVTLAEGQSREVNVTMARPVAAVAPLAPAPPSSSPPPPVHERHRSPAFGVLIGVATASLATSVVTGALALIEHEDSNFSGTCSSVRSYCSEQSSIDNASTAKTMAWVSTITLGGAAVTGVLAFLVPMQDHVVTSVGIGGPGGSGGTFALKSTW
jgi:hypothetical protein